LNSLKDRFLWVGFAGGILILQAVLVYSEFYWFLLLPVLLLLGAWLFRSLDKFFLFTVLVTPLSLDFESQDLGAGISVPSEILIFLLTLMFWLKWLIEPGNWRGFWRHPLTLAVLFHLGWMLFSSFFSAYPVVSFKFFVTRFWFVTVFYFLGAQLFRRKTIITGFLWAFYLPLIGVVVYTLYRHSLYQFEKQPAHWVMDPFFQDHTHYGAVLAMFIPFGVGIAFWGRLSGFVRMIAIVLAIVLVTGLVMSISRAAWLSVFGVLGLLFYMLFRIRWYVLFVFGGVLSALFFTFKTDIIMALEKNKNESSQDFSEHLRSATNIRSDASNTERLLRWNAAIRMFKDRPITGFGPGTYQFCYAPYQRSNELTIISTNFGSGGNAHSEYLGPLAEQGLGGLLSVLFLIAAFVYSACRYIFVRGRDKYTIRLAYMVLLGLCTYFMHGTLNNFLNTDEASVPFWGFMGIIVSLDLYYGSRDVS
jgi:putative inorganic carbon (HCO3(-)) transporter